MKCREPGSSRAPACEVFGLRQDGETLKVPPNLDLFTSGLVLQISLAMAFVRYIGMKILGQGDMRNRQDEAIRFALGTGVPTRSQSALKAMASSPT